MDKVIYPHPECMAPDGADPCDGYKALMKYAGGLEAKLDRTCKWSHDSDGLWQTECLEEWAFYERPPQECGVKFCPSCGGKAEFNEGEQE